MTGMFRCYIHTPESVRVYTHDESEREGKQCGLRVDILWEIFNESINAQQAG